MKVFIKRESLKVLIKRESLATFRNLSQDYGDLESGEFGPYVP
jgi:hypothetical protein